MTWLENPMKLRHNKVHIALHRLREDPGGPSLLLLHGLGEQSPAAVPPYAEAWPGAVYALDFMGHGKSDMSVGGGYTAEVLMADADIALSRLGPSTIVGRGLGAYIGLLIAGARPSLVRGLVIADGPGLAGGGVGPVSSSIPYVDQAAVDAAPPDPWVLVELSRDVRPPDYATSFVRQFLATANQTTETPLAVVARWRAPWVDAVVDEPGVVEAESLEQALALVSPPAPRRVGSPRG